MSANTINCFASFSRSEKRGQTPGGQQAATAHCVAIPVGEPANL
jgi:hypothetical protein